MCEQFREQCYSSSVSDLLQWLRLILGHVIPGHNFRSRAPNLATVLAASASHLKLRGRPNWMFERYGLARGRVNAKLVRK